MAQRTNGRSIARKMKTNTSDMWRVTSDELKDAAREVCSRHASRVTRPTSAFTLIELLTVIAIIGVIAGFVLVVAGPVKKKQYIFNTQAEMAKLETAIDRYQAAYGFYPPSPTTPPTAGNPSSLYNQLFYELEGTIGDGNSSYTNLDGSDIIKAADVPLAFPGIGGFIN